MADLSSASSHRQRHTAAQNLFSQLPAHYVDLRWVKIEAALLQHCTELQGRLGMPRDRLLSTLALLRAGMELNSPKWDLSILQDESKLASEEGATSLADALVSDVKLLSQSLTKGQLFLMALDRTWLIH